MTPFGTQIPRVESPKKPLSKFLDTCTVEDYDDPGTGRPNYSFSIDKITLGISDVFLRAPKCGEIIPGKLSYDEMLTGNPCVFLKNKGIMDRLSALNLLSGGYVSSIHVLPTVRYVKIFEVTPEELYTIIMKGCLEKIRIEPEENSRRKSRRVQKSTEVSEPALNLISSCMNVGSFDPGAIAGSVSNNTSVGAYHTERFTPERRFSESGNPYRIQFIYDFAREACLNRQWNQNTVDMINKYLWMMRLTNDPDVNYCFILIGKLMLLHREHFDYDFTRMSPAASALLRAEICDIISNYFGFDGRYYSWYPNSGILGSLKYEFGYNRKEPIPEELLRPLRG
jgi:hypothetical protein